MSDVASAGESLPLGMWHSAGLRGASSPPRAAGRGERALSVAARLLAGATTFFFLAFLFAYFYLRSINTDGWWKPTASLLKEQNEVHVSLSPGQGLGAAFIACIVLSAR